MADNRQTESSQAETEIGEIAESNWWMLTEMTTSRDLSYENPKRRCTLKRKVEIGPVQDVRIVVESGL